MATRESADDTPRRRYDGRRRRAAAAASRAAIATAARERFVEGGWAGTSVRAVAAQAGVAEATVYAAFGSKAGLALAVLHGVEADADLDGLRAALAAGTGDPRGQLAALVASDRQLFERAGDVIELMIDAGRSEPALRDAYATGRRHGDRVRRAVFAEWAPGTLAAGVGLDGAVDAYAALCNVHVWRVLTVERGRSPARAQRWLTEAVARLLLAGDGRRDAAGATG